MSVIEFPRRPVRPIPQPERSTTLREWVLVGVAFGLVVIAQWVLL
ncbi:MAG: hypothetical protein ACK5X3_04800 [Pseudomonadota bacterium]|jgi:hypothetical protein